MSVRMLALCALPLALAAAVDREASLAAAEKFQRIADGSLESGASVELLQDEMNAFLRFHAADQVPEGVEDPEVAFRQGGAVVRARVDLEKAGASLESIPALMRLLMRGSRSITVDFDYEARDGYATARLVSMTVESLQLEGSTLELFLEILAPESLRPYLLGGKASLEPGVREIRLEPGRAVIVAD